MSFFALAGEMVSALISGMKPLGSALLAEFRAGRLVFVFSEVYCSYRSSLAAPRRGSKPTSSWRKASLGAAGGGGGGWSQPWCFGTALGFLGRQLGAGNISSEGWALMSAGLHQRAQEGFLLVVTLRRPAALPAAAASSGAGEPAAATLSAPALAVPQLICLLGRLLRAVNKSCHL